METQNRYFGDVTLGNEPLFHDDRGLFVPTEMDVHNVQTNISINKHAYTFRGMHLQTGEFAQSKRLKVLCGSIVDFFVNLIPGDDYEKVGYFRMGPGDTIIVPRGYAHGFLTLCDNTIVQYLVDNEYNQESDLSINYASFKEINQIINNESNCKLCISSKDENAPLLSQFSQDLRKKKTDIFGFSIYSTEKG